MTSNVQPARTRSLRLMATAHIRTTGKPIRKPDASAYGNAFAHIANTRRLMGSQPTNVLHDERWDALAGQWVSA